MDILEQIRQAGVIGAGGAGFPTHVKLKASADFILMNAAECEPLLRVDEQLIEMFSGEIIEGFLAAKRTVNASEAIIGIKGKHKEAIEVLEETIRSRGLADEVRIGILPDMYPAGDEQVLVYELTGRVVPETAIPIAVGCVVINVETSLNIYRALSGEPVTETYLTVAGDVPRPVTLRVPVGTPVSEVFAAAGADDRSAYGIINGGPMMGPLLGDNELYVTKKSKGYILLPQDHPLILKKKRGMPRAMHVNGSACEQCSMCTDLCPRHLLGHTTSPHKMVRAMAFGLEADESMTSALTCCQCNLCEYFSCPAGINPRMANVYYMGKLREVGIRHKAKDEYTPHPMRSWRRVPTKRLIARLGLTAFDGAAPFDGTELHPEYVGIGLKDHVGAPAVPSVSPGQYVSKGDVIAAPAPDALGAFVHASISGTVEKIEGNCIVIRSGR